MYEVTEPNDFIAEATRGMITNAIDCLYSTAAESDLMPLIRGGRGRTV
jgi:hypothetical protein